MTPSSSSAWSRPAVRHGFTLIEVVVSLAILGTVMIGLALFSGRMSQSSSSSRLRIQAAQAASERIELVKTAPRYTAIETLYVATETNWNPRDYPGYVRQTMVKHVGGGPSDTTDFKIVTVQVTNSQMSGSVRKTTIIPYY